MQLESARAELRLRHPTEAMDLGLLLLRALWKPALRTWLGVVLPLQMGVLALGSPWHVGWALAGLVWLAPLFDRVWMLLLGQGLFGPPPRLGALWSQLVRQGFRGLLGDLTWRRLDAPRRALLLPVPLLEGLSGQAAQRRRRVLVATHGGSVWTLWAGRVLIEGATVGGLVALVWMMLPPEAFWTPGMVLGVDLDTFFWRAFAVAFVFAHGLAEALFVAAGFGLYINGRTLVEGWDVELVFRRMARRLARGTDAAVCVALCVLAAASGAAAQAGPAPTQQSEPWSVEPEREREPTAGQPPVAEPSVDEPPSEQTRSAVHAERRRPAPVLRDVQGATEAMARVRARPELQETRFEERWQLRDFGDGDDEPSPLPEWLYAWIEAVAGGVQFALWASVVLCAGAFLFLVVQQVQRVAERVAPPGDPARQVARVHVSGTPARELSAVDALRLARSLGALGRRQEAFATLYVGMIAGLTVSAGLRLPAGATEAQCLRHVRAAETDEGRAALFAELVERRLLVAYAHADIDQAELETWLARYARAFGVPA